MNEKLTHRIVKLIKEEEWNELEELLLNTEDEWVLEMVEQWMYKKDGPQLVGGIFSSLSCRTRESTNLRLKVYEALLKVVRMEVGGSERVIGELVGVLMVHVDTFPTQTLVTLVDQYMDMVCNGHPLQGRWVDLLAKTISTVSQKDDVVVEGRKMTGEDYRYQMLKTLCDLPWSSETATCLLPVIRDMDLPKEELEDVIHKVESVLKKVDYQSVPPIMYHLVLVLQSKLPGRVLQVVMMYFNKQDLKMAAQNQSTNQEDISTVDLIDDEAIEDSRKTELTEAKGTVILHLTHQAQYNPALVKDFIKLVRSSTWLTEKLITPFNLSLAFSLTSIGKFQDQILDSLKSCLLKFFREEERSNQSQWLREAWGSDCDLRTAFLTTVENCVMGWDQVSQGVVQLAFSLLETGGGFKGETYASQHAVELAVLVLPLIVKRQPHLMHSVVSQISNFILLSPSPVQYIVILEKLAKSVPLVLLEHHSVLCQVLEYLEHLSLGAATQLLLALYPLLKMNMALKDTLIITLRKMLFSRKVKNRQIAVRGFLQFLKYFRVMGTLPSSQASMSFSSSLSSTSVIVSVHSEFNSTTNEALCMELLGVLRRCFSQQQDVKRILYQGLYEVCEANPRLLVNVLELLLQHTRTFIDMRTDTLNPIKLGQVIQVQGENVTLAEPIGNLLSTLAACQALYHHNRELASAADDDDDDDNATTVLNDICSMFDVLTEKLSGCDLDDMGINTNGDFSSGSTAGMKNHLSTEVMMGVFDSLIERTFTQGCLSRDTVTTILALFRSQKKIVDLVKEKSQKPGKKGEGKKGRGRSAGKAVLLLKSNMNMRVAANMLATTLAEGEGEEDGRSVHRILGNNHDFQMFLLSVMEENLSSFKELTRLERDKLLPHLRVTAKILLEECCGCVGGQDSSSGREVDRIRHALNILATLISIFCKHYKHKLEAVLKEVLGKTEVSSLSVLLHKVVKRCQKMLLRILNHQEHDPLLKDATTLVVLLTTITRAMHHSSPELRDVQEWILQLCKDQSFDNPALTEALTKLLFQLSDQVKANHTLTREVARELHHKLGDNVQDLEVEGSNKFAMVTEDLAPTVLSCTLQHQDAALSLVELSLQKMRACITRAVDIDVIKVEQYVINKCGSVISSMHEIIVSALPPGHVVDRTLTVVTKLYSVLSLFVKYYLDLYHQQCHAQLSEKYEKLVKMSGELISGPIYPMITYVENTQKEAASAGKAGGVFLTRAIKESKLIPSLIFAVEQYENDLIKLSRKAKVNLMQGMKISTTRDFRIISDALMEGLEKEDTEEEEEEEDNRENAEENRERSRNSPVSEKERESEDENMQGNSPSSSPPPPAVTSSSSSSSSSSFPTSRKDKQNNIKKLGSKNKVASSSPPSDTSSSRYFKNGKQNGNTESNRKRTINSKDEDEGNGPSQHRASQHQAKKNRLSLKKRR